MNVASFMSKTRAVEGKHLEEFEGYLFVHTRKLLEDFEGAVTKLEMEFKSDAALLERAESRLRRSYIPWTRWKGRAGYLAYLAHTQPADVEFIELARPSKISAC